MIRSRQKRPLLTARDNDLIKTKEDNGNRTIRTHSSFYSEAWEHMQLPVIITGTDFEIQYVNPAFATFTGYTLDEIAGQTPYYLFSDTFQKMQVEWRDCIPEKGRFECQVKRKDGRNCWAEVFTGVIRRPGKAGLRLITLHDISENKRLEEALRYSEDKFTRLFDAIPIPLSITTVTDRRFIEVNKSFLDTGEMQRDEVIGRRSSELNWKDEHEADRVGKEMLEKGRATGVEMSLISKSGVLHTALLKAEVVKLGDCDYLVSASIDITDRKRTEKALQESEARFRMLSENSLSGIFIFREGRFSYVNPAFASMLGRPRDEITGCVLASFVHPEDANMVNEVMRKRLEGELTKMQYSFRCYRGDGKIVWLEALSTRLEDEGQPALLSTVLDITEQRKIEEEADRLRQVMDHVSRVNTLGELAASIAHELNQPLTAIMTNAQTILRILNRGQGHHGEIKDILEDIISDDRRAGDIIRRMREPLKRDQLTMELLDLNHLINEIYQLVRNDAAISGVRIDLALASGLPLIRGDKTQLQQVLLNLMVNALDAVKEQNTGERKIEIRSSAGKDRRLIRVEIKDTGPGITETNRAHLFELFSSTKPNGLGVGLSICKRLIHDHGGRIWQENLPEGGAGFIFTLPVKR
ncbi:MAG: PAS domain S-box protein [Dehalococcoidales bacterium]|nr:PAS domain S-box protein [Dehalococcoidales bacterium]